MSRTSRVRPSWLASLALSCIVYSLLPALANAGTVTLSWVQPTTNTDGSPLTDLSGYRVYSGCSRAGTYERTPVAVPDSRATSLVLSDLPDALCWFVVTALNARGAESAQSNPASKDMSRPVERPSDPTAPLVATWTQSPDAPPVLSRIGGRFAQLNPGQSGTIVWPAGTAAGQAVLLDCSWYERYNNAVPTVPAGFVAVTPSVVLGGTGTSESRAQLFAAVLDGPRTGSLPIAFSGSVYANCVLDIYQAPTPITSITAAVGTPASGTTATAPAVSTPGYLVWAYSLTDPATMTTPNGAQPGQAGGTATNTAQFFFAPDRASGGTAARSARLEAASARPFFLLPSNTRRIYGFARHAEGGG